MMTVANMDEPHESSRSESPSVNVSVSDDGNRRGKRKRLSSSHGNVPREMGVMRNSAANGNGTFVGSASGIHFIKTVYETLSRRAKSKEAANEDFSVPGEDDRLRTPATPHPALDQIWCTNEVHTLESESSVQVVTFDNLIQWTESFFDSWHPLLPFLHAPSVLIMLERLSEAGMASLSSLETIIIRSIISISLVDRRQTNRGIPCAIPSELLFNSVDDALGCSHLILREPANIISLQASLAVQTFLVAQLRLNAASRVGGLIVRMAYQLGLHRCPSRYHTFTRDDCDIRIRLFWSAYCLDRLICQSLGLPLGIRDDDIDVCFPNNELHRLSGKHNVHHGRQESNLNSQPDGRLRLLEVLARKARIKGAILELRNKSYIHSEENASSSIFISAELSKWWNEVQEDVEPLLNHLEGDIDTEGPQSDYSSESFRPLHRLVILTSRHESIIALNRPLLAHPKTSAAYAAALQTCIESSRSVVLSMHGYLVRQQGDQSTKLGTAPLVWPSFTWAIWMSCFILLHAASESQFPVKSALRYADMGISILNNLALRGSPWPQACAAAILHLRPALVQPSLATSNPDKIPTGHTVTRQPSIPTLAHHSSVPKATASRNHHQFRGVAHTNPRSPSDILTHSSSPHQIKLRDVQTGNPSYVFDVMSTLESSVDAPADRPPNLKPDIVRMGAGPRSERISNTSHVRSAVLDELIVPPPGYATYNQSHPDPTNLETSLAAYWTTSINGMDEDTLREDPLGLLDFSYLVPEEFTITAWPS